MAMICPYCSKGRIVAMTGFHQGRKPPIMIPEIQGICEHCGGSGVSYCCDGAGENFGNQRAEVIIEIADALEEAINEAE